MAIDFPERLDAWQDRQRTRHSATAMTLVTAALIAFGWFGKRK